jgi:hypothetical protein
VIRRPRFAPALYATIAVAHVIALQGCASAPARPALPSSPTEPVLLPGLPADVRYWADDPSAAFRDWLAVPADAPRDCCAALMDRPHHYLVISSGGVEGAFGAGLLAGWTATGTRPEFQLVTGVSAGAMIAPFAFLGSAYDGALREIYSNYSTNDLVERRGVFESLSGDAVMDTAPLRRLIDRYLGDDEIARIAAEGRRGRKLLIATTHLNAARPVVWDLTKIAASGAVDARGLIGDLILASCSIPGVFPPVRITVEAGGVRFDELHVDGGVTAQLFLGPPGVNWTQVTERLHVHGRPQVYLVRNARAYPWWTALRTQVSPLLERSVASESDEGDGQMHWKEIEPRVSPILRRSLTSMLRSRGLNDAVQIYVKSHGDELGFNLARIPDDFSEDSTEFVDPLYMRALFERGYAMAADGNPWLHAEDLVTE